MRLILFLIMLHRHFSMRWRWLSSWFDQNESEYFSVRRIRLISLMRYSLSLDSRSSMHFELLLQKIEMPSRRQVRIFRSHHIIISKMSFSHLESVKLSWQYWVKNESQLLWSERWLLRQNLGWIRSQNLNSIDSYQFLLSSKNIILQSIERVQKRYFLLESMRKCKWYKIILRHLWILLVVELQKMYQKPL